MNGNVVRESCPEMIAAAVIAEEPIALKQIAICPKAVVKLSKSIVGTDDWTKLPSILAEYASAITPGIVNDWGREHHIRKSLPSEFEMISLVDDNEHAAIVPR
jgi:hypothetical protein